MEIPAPRFVLPCDVDAFVEASPLGIEDDAFYYSNRRNDRSYISGAFPELSFDPSSRPMRFATRVIDNDRQHLCEVDGGEIVLRETVGGRQEVKALFYEDDRSIRWLTVQRFTADTNKPHRTSFTFSGKEIEAVVSLFHTLAHAKLDDAGKARFSDQFLEDILVDDAELLRFVQLHRERLGLLDSVGEFTLYLEFRERQRQVRVFEQLLHEPDFFEQMAWEWKCDGPEAVWQRFFERNPWIFGLSLAPLFMSALDDHKLEQVVKGASIASEGKRVDALMQTNAMLSSLCFVEIKTHDTHLLQQVAKPYRPGAWRVSAEVAGAVTQCQTTVHAAMQEIETRLRMKDEYGNPTGEEIYLYQPRSYLVVGCLSEFLTDHGANEEKFRSFELFRHNTKAPEIVTFDELLERARAIIDCSPSNRG
jgi:hypothetical protein